MLQLRSDNGYSATRPEERNYALDGLNTFSKRLREAKTISIPYIRQYAIEPMRIAAKTLGRSAAGLAIDVLKDQIKIWLEKNGIPWPFGR